MSTIRIISRQDIEKHLSMQDAVKAVEQAYVLNAEKGEVLFATVFHDFEEGKADIIVTATPSRKPLVMKGWLKPGTHLSCMGADMAGKQEIDGTIFDATGLAAQDILPARELMTKAARLGFGTSAAI